MLLKKKRTLNLWHSTQDKLKLKETHVRKIQIAEGGHERRVQTLELLHQFMIITACHPIDGICQIHGTKVSHQKRDDLLLVLLALWLITERGETTQNRAMAHIFVQAIHCIAQLPNAGRQGFIPSIRLLITEPATSWHMSDKERHVFIILSWGLGMSGRHICNSNGVVPERPVVRRGKGGRKRKGETIHPAGWIREEGSVPLTGIGV